jgi:hypothetical protein
MHNLPQTFGTNALELSHMQTAPLPAAGMAAFASACQEAGLNVSVWVSVESLAANLSATAVALAGMPKLDSLFFPGGDGGR